ncbi:hypothetical protein [Nocardiopsis xinjiangensis]|uniref:hypothetical protein n=1 Tax=Nocardiopsis xinjiangensis TaxID=124285 RepID=UPI000A060649|nr:hypothetical protein [Nocardiopsis xinjiangensis]
MSTERRESAPQAPGRHTATGIVTGLLTVGAALGTAELTAALARTTSPVVAVGDADRLRAPAQRPRPTTSHPRTHARTTATEPSPRVGPEQARPGRARRF